MTNAINIANRLGRPNVAAALDKMLTQLLEIKNCQNNNPTENRTYEDDENNFNNDNNRNNFNSSGNKNGIDKNEKRKDIITDKYNTMGNNPNISFDNPNISNQINNHHSSLPVSLTKPPRAINPFAKSSPLSPGKKRRATTSVEESLKDLGAASPSPSKKLSVCIIYCILL